MRLLQTSINSIFSPLLDLLLEDLLDVISLLNRYLIQALSDKPEKNPAIRIMSNETKLYIKPKPSPKRAGRRFVNTLNIIGNQNYWLEAYGSFS